MSESEYIEALESKLGEKRIAAQGFNLLPALRAVEKIVADLASGAHEPFTLPNRQISKRRFAPSFIVGKKPRRGKLRPYNAASLAKELGLLRSGGRRNSPKASEIVEVSLRILEMRERGLTAEAEIEAICSGRFTMREIERLFPKSEKEELKLTETASAILELTT